MHAQADWRLIGLTVALAGPGAVAAAAQLGAPASLVAALLGEAALGGLVTAVALIVTRGERQSLTSIGLNGILLPVLIGSAILTGVFLWRRDLVIVIIAHVLTDSYGLIVEPLLAAR